MMLCMQPPVKRRYDASRRRQAAERTRAAILDAARQLFTQRGWTPERYEHFLADLWHRLLLSS